MKGWFTMIRKTLIAVAAAATIALGFGAATTPAEARVHIYFGTPYVGFYQPHYYQPYYHSHYRYRHHARYHTVCRYKRVYRYGYYTKVKKCHREYY
jgi:hypothetical protein